MSYRQGPNRAPMHGGGRFDDPFMIPEPPPRGERPQRRQALVALLVIAAVLAAIAVLATLD
jgi:hypothetical protein